MIKAPMKVKKNGAYEVCHPETEVSQITDIDNYVNGKDNTILSSAKSYADTKKSEAISAASSDATTKANNAQTNAINNAKQYFKGISTDGAIQTITLGNGSTISFTPILNTAEAHNSAPIRGKDITSKLNDGTLAKVVANGTFEDVYIGDYVTVNSKKWVVAHLDYFYNSGDSQCTTHHILFITDSTYADNVNMNDTNTTSGAFIGSKMWTTTIPKYQAEIVSAFGDSHVLTHRELLSNGWSSTAASAAGAGWVGASTGWGWYDVRVNIPSEPMIYGGAVFGSSGHDVGNKERQLALFRNHKFCNARKWFWLQAVASSSSFCRAADSGNATCVGASNSSSDGGFRPYFLYH